MRVIDMSMEQRRNERAGETAYPRENPPTNGIVRHDSHMRRTNPNERQNELITWRNPTSRGRPRGSPHDDFVRVYKREPQACLLSLISTDVRHELLQVTSEFIPARNTPPTDLSIVPLLLPRWLKWPEPSCRRRLVVMKLTADVKAKAVQVLVVWSVWVGQHLCRHDDKMSYPHASSSIFRPVRFTLRCVDARSPQTSLPLVILIAARRFAVFAQKSSTELKGLRALIEFLSSQVSTSANTLKEDVKKLFSSVIESVNETVNSHITSVSDLADKKINHLDRKIDTGNENV
ncbi:hypothetical protein PR048_026751 [Dryococelus australis]|uniref:Uncharacterized protein n=1 Tax=Dryococelus australis TaxID=614101 RepID=A0ABQ9GM94_9NEOP|nr:hypothetical protein PR048_026751 [Dryococelus australis]